MVASIKSPPRQFARKLFLTWNREIPLWQQKISFLLHEWPINKNFEIRENKKQDVVILKLYDMDIVTLDKKVQHELQSFYSTQLPEVNTLATFDFTTFDGFSNQPPPLALQTTLSKLIHGVLFKFVISENTTSLINHLYNEKSLKKRSYYTFYIESDINAKTTEGKDALSDQFFTILKPNKQLNKSFASPKHLLIRTTSLRNEIREIYPNFTLRFFNYYFYSPQKRLIESSFLVKNISDVVASTIKATESVTVLFKDDLRIKEEIWKLPSTLVQRHDLILKVKNKVEMLIIPNVDRETLIALENLKSKAKYLSLSLIEILSDTIDTEKINNFLWVIPDFTVSIITIINEFNIYIKKKTDSLYRSDIADILDTGIAYLCGFINGLIDVVQGIFDLILLLLKIVHYVLTHWGPEIEVLITETIDEIMQLISLDDISGCLDEMLTVIKEGYDVLTDKGADLIEYLVANEHKLSNPRILGYNLGYAVYEIIENYIPPLKITSKASQVLKPILKAVS